MLQRITSICRLAQPPAEQTAFLRFGSTKPDSAPKDAAHAASISGGSYFSRLNSPKGFSLVELMIAMTLFAIVSLGVYPLMWTNILTNSKNGLRKGAETVAVRWMDTLSARGYNGLTTVAETTDPINTNFTYQVVVTTNAANDRKDVILTIRWSLGSNSYNYTVQTVKVRNS